MVGKKWAILEKYRLSGRLSWFSGKKHPEK
jgi:hypothetical protein